MFKLSHLVKSVVKFDIKCVFTHQGSLVCSANSVTRVFDGVFCKIQNLPCCTHKGKRKCQFPTKTSNTKKYENQSKLKINFKILNLIFFQKMDQKLELFLPRCTILFLLVLITLQNRADLL